MTALHTRCPWPGTDERYLQYHDQEWGVPCRNDRKLFEFLLLEGAQAGLSWITILKRREGYRAAFAGFDAEQVARFSDEKLAELLTDPGIIRNRLKVESARVNARGFLAIQEAYGSFAEYLWRFVEGEPIQNNWHSLAEVPVTTPQSDALSKDLKQRGFKFVGSTICYAYMQAMGLVNDHLTDCYRHRECQALATPPSQPLS